MSETKTKPETAYLGDGLYASHDGYQFVLEANGIWLQATDRVYLEPEVAQAFINYVKLVTGRTSL